MNAGAPAYPWACRRCTTGRRNPGRRRRLPVPVWLVRSATAYPRP
jgi:hypothetical protein